MYVLSKESLEVNTQKWFHYIYLFDLWTISETPKKVQNSLHISHAKFVCRLHLRASNLNFSWAYHFKTMYKNSIMFKTIFYLNTYVQRTLLRSKHIGLICCYEAWTLLFFLIYLCPCNQLAKPLNQYNDRPSRSHNDLIPWKRQVVSCN
jgi:hypothetical protein